MTAHADSTLVSRIQVVPPVFDPRRAEYAFQDIEKAIAKDGFDHAEAVTATLATPQCREALAALFGNSPYLTRIALRFPEFLPSLFDRAPEDLCEALLQEVRDAGMHAENSAALMTVMRQAKAKVALLAALADITQVWDLFEVTGALTVLADVCLQAGLSYLLAEAHTSGKLRVPNPDDPQQHCGITILAMGKYGAAELNYSSDIDIIVFFDQDVFPVAEGVEPKQLCVKITKELVRYMQEMTSDGYVFRTDLRLRPDAGATAVAVPILAAEQYYEGMGQNWERAAMIKARHCAGDDAVGARFQKTLAPFIWRKYLDYAAIEDIHSIKRQIHSHGKHKAIAVAGHNVKLGLGGIREIEFFVQTQQLIMGGRNPGLRNRMTCHSLDDLAAFDMIEAQTGAELKESYAFLRMVEHRLQMKDDMQTHVMPKSAEDIDHIARFAGYDDTAVFEHDLLFHLRRVNKHYINLFAQEEALSGAEGSLVFTGVDDDPDTLETLQKLGFQRPSDVAATVRAWHYGRIRATRSERARELLTKLLPVMLEAIAKTADPDTTFARFQDFLKGLPSGVQLFSLFYSHADLLYLLTDALGTAPRLGPYLASNPSVIDALLDTDFLTSLPSHEELESELVSQVNLAKDYEDSLNRVRRWGKDHSFRIGLQVLRGMSRSDVAGPAYANLAEVVIQALEPLARQQIVDAHGYIADSEFVVIGMGKMGGRELTATSDLDLVMVYDFPQDIAESDGKKALDGTRYFTRLTQRFITALSAPTAEGMLYEVDMQLRPSGKAGPVATKFASFKRYYEDDAWTWEKMALTRARVLAGSETLQRRISDDINAILTSPRDVTELATDIVDMRARLEREKGSKDPWNLKQVRGGVIDIEFICQFLQLAYASEHPDILDQNTATAFFKMKGKDILPNDTLEHLMDAADLLLNITQVTRIALSGAFAPAEAGDGLLSLLAQSVGADNFAAVEAKLLNTQSFVHQIFEDVVASKASIVNES